MTTVLTLEPLDFNIVGNTMLHNLRGEPVANNAVVQVVYPASFAAASIPKGVAALDKLVKTIAGPKLVYGHSQGAQVASRWLREHADDYNAPPENLLKFLLIGNPLRKYGGYIIGKPEVGGMTGLPTLNDTQYEVTDVKMQYDGWADVPNKSMFLANWNASVGRGDRHCFGYRDATLSDPKRKVFKENTTTYVMLPGKPLLKLIPQDKIEEAYSRPEVYFE
jgi:pimeloyl-ACP methyl ester carboxylesterase